MAPQRKNERALVSIVARYRSPLIFDYVNERCYDLSYGGMFIKSNNPINPGTLLKLECLVDDGPEKIQGVARVVWVRRVDRPDGPRGMGVKFVKLEPGSEELIEKIIEKAGSVPAEAASDESIESQETVEADRDNREAPQPEQKAEEEAKESVEEPSVAQTSPVLEEGTQASPDTAEEDREEADETPRDQAGGESIQSSPTVEPKVAVAPSSKPEQKGIVFPKWAIAVCAIAVIGLVFISMYDSDESVKPTDRADLKQAEEENALSLPEQVSNSTEPAVDTVGLEESVAATGQVSESSPVEEDETPGEESLSSGPVQSDPATSANVPIQTDPKYVLKITTSPPGARVHANNQSITSPGTIELSTGTSPIRVMAWKKDHHSTRVVVERSIFVREANTMKGEVHLDLKPKRAKSEAPQPEQPQKEPLDEAKTEIKTQPTNVPEVTTTGGSQASEDDSPAPKDQTDSTAQEEQSTKTTDAPPQTDAPQTPFSIATQCVKKGDNDCVINALKDKASTKAELGLLIETYRSIGDMSNAIKYMKRFIEKYPKSEQSDVYRKIVESNP